ncbi:hypothetical protein NFI96_020171, partial [Prochilodus magdalenae]
MGGYTNNLVAGHWCCRVLSKGWVALRSPVNSSVVSMSESGVEELDWPAQSPDLSPIEHLWDGLERRLRARPSRPTSVSDLTNAPLEEWKLLYQLYSSTALQLHSSTAPQLHSSTAPQLYSSTAPQLYSSTALQLYSSTALQLYSSTAPQLHSSTAPQLHSSTAPQLHSSTAPQLHSSTALQLYSSTALQLHSSTALQLHSSTAPQLYSSTALQLHSSTAPHLYSSTAPQLHSSTAPHLYSSTAPQLYSSTALQLHSSTAPQLHSSTAPHLYSSTSLHLYISTAPQLYSSTALQLYSSTAPQLYSSLGSPDLPAHASFSPNLTGVMRSYRGRCFSIACLILSLWTGVCLSSGYLELRLERVENSGGQLASGRCCGGEGSCSCRTYFRACAKEYQVEVSEGGPCSYGSASSGVLGGNSFQLDKHSDTGTVVIPFGFAWP